MRVGVFLSNYPVASETFISRQISGLVERGHNVVVIAGKVNHHVADPLQGRVVIAEVRDSSRTVARSLFQALVMTSKVPSSWEGRRLLVSLAAALNGLLAPAADIAALAGRHLGEFDAILAHFGPAGVRAMYLRDAMLISGPIATVFHGVDVTQRSFLRRYLRHYRRLFKRTELFLPVSDLWRGRLIGWSAPPEQTKVVRMGVDVMAYTPTDLRRPVGSPLKVLSVGRFVEKKGLLSAIEAVTRSAAPIEYEIIGYGPLEAELRAAAFRSDRNKITILGKRTHAEVIEHLKRADIFLLPSVTAGNGDMEGVPISLMEAMMIGVAVVSTRHSGIPELVEHGTSGLLVPENDSRAIAAALEDISAGRVDVARLRRAAREKVRTDYNNELLLQELEAVLEHMALCDTAAPSVSLSVAEIVRDSEQPSPDEYASNDKVVALDRVRGRVGSLSPVQLRRPQRAGFGMGREQI